MPDEEAKEFQRRLEGILGELMEGSKIELYGNLKVEVVDMDEPAFIRGNKIYVSADARAYPDHVLKYMIAHELAHLLVKAHTRRFWEIVRMIYPEYERGKKDLLRIHQLHE
jgi:hypothetical protein